MNYIYALKDPIEHEVRYVGKTNNLQTRFSFHLRNRSKNHKSNWIKNLESKGLLPYMQVLEEIDNDNWEDRECYYINKYRKKGKLTNLTDGGEGVKGFTDYITTPVDCYDLTGAFLKGYISITSAAKELKITPSNITGCCMKRTKSAGGYIWRYKNEPLDKIVLNEKAKPIVQLSLKEEFIREYSSITEAAKYLGCAAPNISRVLRGLRKKFRKSIFKYKDIV